jgi:hypothetical protein
VIAAILEPIPVTLNRLIRVPQAAVAAGCDGRMNRKRNLSTMGPSLAPSKVRCSRGRLEHSGRKDYCCRQAVGGLHVAAIFFRRNDDNRGAGDPYKCIRCRRTYPQTAGHRPVNDSSLNASTAFGSFRRAGNLTRATLRRLRRETRPRPPHGPVSWTGGRGPVSTATTTRRSRSNIPRARLNGRQHQVCP